MKLAIVVLFLVCQTLSLSNAFVNNFYGKWYKNKITYKILNRPSHLPPLMVRREIKRAFHQWSSVTDLTFKEVKFGKADINIQFSKNYVVAPGKFRNFDGPGGKNAFSLYPNFGGDVYFDIDEPWSLRDYEGKSLFQIATHEIGHSLGLPHTRNRNDVMYEYYIGYINNFRLSRNDIYNIRVNILLTTVSVILKMSL